MKMIFKGIESTFRAAYNAVTRVDQQNTQLQLAVMLAMLKRATPKDTGFASSEWQIEGMFPRFRVRNDASYIEYLNNGSSKQAPAFFIEKIALRFGKPVGAVVTVEPSSPGSK